MKAGVTYMMKFVSSKNQKFSSYINYIDREEAARTNQYKNYNFAFDDVKKKDLDTYNEYMGRPEATSGLFTSESDDLSLEERKTLKESFKTAQKNKSLMWQDVISFDNSFLEKYGLYDSKTKQLNDQKLKTSARLAVEDMLKHEGMSNSAVWSGAIHYNTDNIHIHIAIVEPEPTREKRTFYNKNRRPYEDYVGVRRERAGGQTAYEHFKSMVLEHIVDNSEKSAQISNLQRNVLKVDQHRLSYRLNFKMQQDYKALFQELPNDKRLWKYRMNGMKDLRPKIEAFNRAYLKKYQPKEYQEYLRLLDEQVDYFQSAYGDSRAKDYKENKLYGKDGLYTSLGNTLLKEMNQYDQTIKDTYGIKGNGKVDLDHLPSLNPLGGKGKKFNSHRPPIAKNLKSMFDKTLEQKQREFLAEQFRRELEAEKEEKGK